VNEWRNDHSLHIINTLRVPTCIRPQGDSVIDLVFANDRAFGRINNWHTSNAMPCSDHALISFSVNSARIKSGVCIRSSINRVFPRWSFKRVNTAELKSYVAFMASFRLLDAATCPDDFAEKLHALMRNACDFAMPRNRGSSRASY